MQIIYAKFHVLKENWIKTVMTASMNAIHGWIGFTRLKTRKIQIKKVKFSSAVTQYLQNKEWNTKRHVRK